MKNVVVILLALIVFASCQSNQSNKNAKVTITAAGATFPQPFYNQVFNDYSTQTGNTLT